MTRFRNFLVGAAALATFSTEAQAYGTWNYNNVCGGNLFVTCASIGITSAAGTSAGQTLITIVVTNLSGNFGSFAGTKFTAIGLHGLPTGSTMVGGSFSATGGGSWNTTPNGLNGAGIQNEVVGAGSNNGINGGLGAGQTVTFVFQITGPGSTYVFDDIALHGQGGPQGCSTKYVITNGTVNQGPFDPACGGNVAPEPASMILLGTGLSAFGAGFARRRRNKTAA